MNLGFISSAILSFVRVIGSTVVGEHGAVLLGGEGAVGDVDDPLGDGSSDKFNGAEQYGPLGLVWRPLPPTLPNGAAPKTQQEARQAEAAEGIAVRNGEGLKPVGARDLRINRRFAKPKPGTIALVGYGGGFLSFDTDLKNNGAGGVDFQNRATLYVPYAYSGGVPGKAMVIAVDPEAESMMLIHGDGYAVVLDKDNGITLRGGASSWINVKDGTIDIVAAKVNVQGIVALGANTSTATPLNPGPVAPARPSVFLSPV